MKDKFKERKIISLKIKAARLRIAAELDKKTITTDDLKMLLEQNNDFGIIKVNLFKDKLLQEIFNAPFLLCDQSGLDLDLKNFLPEILSRRYYQEIRELRYLHSIGYIAKDELKEQWDLIKFCYYYTSEEGEYILRRGHVKNHQDDKNKVLKI